MTDVFQRLRMLVTRGVVNTSVLKPGRTEVQVGGLFGETIDKVQLLLPHGMSALPASGAQVILLQVAGSRSHLLAICADDGGLRITDLQAGEFGFHDARQQQVVFRQDHLEITTPLKVVGQAAEWDLTGDVKINGKVTATGDITSTGGDITDQVRSMAADRDIYNEHQQTVTGGIAGPPTPTM